MEPTIPNTPITPTEPQPVRKNIWKPVAIIFIILSVLFVGLSVFLLLRNTTEPTPDGQKESDTSEVDAGDQPSVSDDQNSELPTYAYLIITDWGIKLKIPDGLYNVNYSTFQGTGDSKVLSANGSISTPDLEEGASYCNMGMINRFSDADVSDGAVSEEEKDSATKIGKYYYQLLSQKHEFCGDAKSFDLIEDMILAAKPID